MLAHLKIEEEKYDFLSILFFRFFPLSQWLHRFYKTFLFSKRSSKVCTFTAMCSLQSNLSFSKLPDFLRLVCTLHSFWCLCKTWFLITPHNTTSLDTLWIMPLIWKSKMRQMFFLISFVSQLKCHPGWQFCIVMLCNIVVLIFIVSFISAMRHPPCRASDCLWVGY